MCFLFLHNLGSVGVLFSSFIHFILCLNTVAYDENTYLTVFFLKSIRFVRDGLHVFKLLKVKMAWNYYCFNEFVGNVLMRYLSCSGIKWQKLNVIRMKLIVRWKYVYGLSWKVIIVKWANILFYVINLSLRRISKELRWRAIEKMNNLKVLAKRRFYIVARESREERIEKWR